MLGHYVSKISFNNRCVSFSIKVQLNSTSSAYTIFRYDALIKIPLKDFIATRQSAQYITHNLDFHFSLFYGEYITFSHIHKNDYQTFLNAPKGKYIPHVVTQFSLKSTNMNSCHQTIVVDIIYSRKDILKTKHLSLAFAMNNATNITFLQDTNFEFRTVFVKTLLSNSGLVNVPCGLNLHIDPYVPIPLYKGPFKLLKYSSCIKNVPYLPALYIISLYFDVSLSWKNGNSFCESFGGHLPTITSKLEERFLTSLLEMRIKGMTGLPTQCKNYPLCYIFLGLRRYHASLNSEYRI